MENPKNLVEIDGTLSKAAAAMAVRTGDAVEDIVEKALLLYLEGPADVLRRLQPQQEELTDEEAMELAISEIRAYRAGQ